MKRFWKDAKAGKVDGGWSVLLDGRAIKTVERADLVVPSETLAEAVAQEWNAVEERIDPRAMPMTGMANAALDRIAPAREEFAAGLAKYAESELCCYRADGPESLGAMQSEAWDPLLEWAAGRYGVRFETTAGVMHVAQPGETLDKLRAALANEDAFTLAGLSPLVTIGGSLVAALAVREGAVSAEEAWDAVEVDARHQAERWGADAEAEARDEGRKRDFLAAARFLDLL
ncbi:ATP12 family chaperone protein [Sphingomicrobium nitratireducens]|uniref:ATP12 family chaperone protein n=1 Tax=Sphingomicrobium nitratireducens TaxID=2964666 RepID=UPI00223EE36B